MQAANCMSSQRDLRKAGKKCSIEGCENIRTSTGGSARGMCGKCYRVHMAKMKVAESEQKPRGRASKTCKAILANGQKCSRPRVSATVGLCKAHESEIKVQRIFDPHYVEDFTMPEREPWSFEGQEEELAQQCAQGD
jgi:hypothetical protein